MLKNLVIRKGVVRGQSILLEGSSGLPEGQAVWVGIGVTDAGATEGESDTEEMIRELEADEALQTIHRMRHTGRSMREL